MRTHAHTHIHKISVSSPSSFSTVVTHIGSRWQNLVLFVLIVPSGDKECKKIGEKSETKKRGSALADKSRRGCDLYFKQLPRLSPRLRPLCGRWPLCKQLLEKQMASLNRCKELWQLDPGGGPGREGTGDNVCQQTLTGLYHNEVSVLEELRGWPANRPPQRAHIPTGQGSGLYVCVCVYVWTEGLLVCLCSEKNAILSFSPPLLPTLSANFACCDLR